VCSSQNGSPTGISASSRQITAIKILLDRPKDWNPHALDQLRQTLRQHDFNAAKLKEAHARVHHKQLADIISMVKHAAREELPILTAEDELFKQRAGNPHFGASLFLVRVFACHWAFIPTPEPIFPFNSPRKVCSVTSFLVRAALVVFLRSMCDSEKFFTLCDTLISGMHRSGSTCQESLPPDNEHILRPLG
jgi:EcoEI R protein C-terminal